MRRRVGRDGWWGVLAVCGAVLGLGLALAAGAQEGDEMSACEARCFDQEQACYDSCDDVACEEACAAAAEACLESCD